MTKREYAEAIANEISNAEVREVEKANGVIMTGIMIKNDTQVTPTIYIDDIYDKGLSVEEASGRIKSDMKNMDIPFFDTTSFTDWEAMKGKLRARLYNKSTKADIKRSAVSYGFSDLIIVPYIQLDEHSSIKVNNNFAEKWGKTPRTIIDTALRNTKEKEKFEIIEMAEIIAEMMGVSVEMLREDASPIWVVSNEQRINGAVGIIILADKLKEMYPNGYYILPSSIHEALIIDVSFCDDPDMLTTMVRDVNGSCVKPEEVLGNRVYKLVA